MVSDSKDRGAKQGEAQALRERGSIAALHSLWNLMLDGNLKGNLCACTGAPVVH